MLFNLSKKIFIIFICILIGLTIINYFFNLCKKKYENFNYNRETKFKLDVTEYIENKKYNYIKPNQYTYLLWSGGFSSTFRLCQLLIVQHKPVQTIYINCCNFNIDNENFNKIKLEIKAMKNIRNSIIKKYPELIEKFPPTMYIDSIIIDSNISKNFNELHNNLGYFEFNSNKDIYENIARLSYHYKYPIEIAIDKDEYYLNKLLQPYLKEINIFKNKIIDLNLVPENLKSIEIFKNCKFPINHLSKKELKILSARFNFFNIIILSWNCSSPKFNQICQNCPNCLKSVI